VNTAFDAVFVVVFMIVAVWVFGFGAGCVLLAHGSRWGRAPAFCVGALLGPVGLIIIGYSRRADRAEPETGWPRGDAQPATSGVDSVPPVGVPAGVHNPLRPPD